MLTCLTCAAVALLSAAIPHQSVQDFPNGIDAVSVGFQAETRAVAVRPVLPDGTRGQWSELAIENEQDPTLVESNLVMFPRGVTRVEWRVSGATPAVHPIVISSALPTIQIAAINEVSSPFIMTRSQWGADESFSTTSARPSTAPAADSVSDVGDNGGSSQREKDCLADQTNYPNEFKISSTSRTNADGDTLRWPWQYSPKVKLFVVHHTAGLVSGDGRSGLERMRALYQFHANSRGWGDIGYHYIVDESGQVYEGKSGGKSVVGGHAYCHNVGTIGISLMGNFDEERPTQAQVKALQKLLMLLADSYDVDLSKSVTYHGETMPAVVGHRDLLSTDCPGFALYGVLDQVRKNVQDGDASLGVTFPAWPDVSDKPHVDQAEQRRLDRLRERGLTDPSPSASSSASSVKRTGFHTYASTTLTGRPGMRTLVTLTYGAEKTLQAGASGGDISRADDGIGLWLAKGDDRQRLNRKALLPERVLAGQSIPVTFEIQFPAETGTDRLTIGDLTLTLVTEGRRMPTAPGQVPASSSSRRSSSSSIRSSSSSRPRSSSSVSSSRSSSSSRSASSSRSSSSRASSSSSKSSVTLPSSTIRIRLTAVSGGDTASVTVPSGTNVGSSSVSSTASLVLARDNGACSVMQGQQTVASAAVVRLAPGEGKFTTIGDRKYRGVVECRVIGDKLVVINELPLEDYMRGISEEPDTEPYEKQRAFAIAARTYAAFYLSPDNRKFPDMPYDGSDSPAEFQAYAGVTLEEKNPRWLKAVDSTASEVLTVGGSIIKAPYFSSDDGRTRAPIEAGWKSFPHAEVFSSKDDPWCDGMTLRGHGVGMSGCGAEGQANEGKTAEQILGYYYPGTLISVAK
ncbi:MAG: N-acetylmuramoyl-L-alanine amidase [Candidatus Peribacteraceae bacterium]|nr:N-acetylmuramoyl-L-alanine amidase [Candidatus Peribacteraceae bacterium]